MRVKLRYLIAPSRALPRHSALAQQNDCPQQNDLAQRCAVAGRRLFIATSLAVSLSSVVSPPAGAQQPVTKLIPLSTLTAAGFQIKAATGQAGVVGTLVLQKDKEVYLCSSKEISIQPTLFECWPVK